MTGSNNTITTTKLSTDTDLHRNYDTSGETDAECYIEQMSLQAAAMLDVGAPYNVYQLAADGLLDISDNDEVTDKDSYVYRILNVQKIDDPVTMFTKAILVRKI